ncbi:MULTISPECIES: NAD(P)/FAD-dependent oxidoreductase [Acidiplasma]|jgi:thioredoxin reductase (NADPH)|uniref:Ferredoxin--NADP reductase n=2 Tax=Acidiplasma TaxID=507753 RepID=A0A0N8VLI2_9ARCH|nr:MULTISPECIES: NAD(P)/FAD-dependent oxidoreductase [Acidiplasma]KJE48806.1 ferredoxin-NADP reductase [Acidiplasma sp. MBA-1]KPV47354.1 ferredoxin-NADP reductase [Acidiplasma aeolicum]KQB36521.1 ferredoxin-NADP reductase [Acidiplasma aeolicum]KQB36596.1 ferredoxin-NADP reductase [Acidiplasma cupricumulans]WMT54195.1 MAG: NAD(P)/FAD-dependent oxidoreductase [Acidiplasma sp.]
MQNYELIIIGAGPIGLYSTFLAGLRDIKSLTLEALDYSGGQIPELYPEKTVYDVQGIPRINAMELRDKMEEQARMFGNEILFNSKVTDIIKTDNGFNVEVNGEKLYSSRAVLICTGMGDFTPRKIGCPGEDDYLNKGLSYTVKDIEKFKDTVVGVVGGGDAAIDYANELAEVASRVYVIHHSEKFRAAEKTLENARKNQKIEFIMNTSVSKISGNSVLENVTLHNVNDNTDKILKLDRLVIAIGHVGKANLFKSINLETSPNKRNIMVNNRFETNIPGIYAVGDVASIAGEPIHPLIAVEGGDAYMAINIIKKYLNPEASIFGGHSSSLNL